MGKSQRTAVGARVASRRRQRGMSRRALAELVGRSEEWLRQLELGERRLENLPVALRLAEVLRIEDLGGFLGSAAPGQEAGSDTAADLLHGLRPAVLDHASVRAFTAEPAPAEPDAVAGAVDDLWHRWWHSPCRYTELSTRLPRLLTALRGAERAGSPDPAVAAAAVSAYHLARRVLCGLGEPGLGNLVADRGMLLAERCVPQLAHVAAYNLAAAQLQGHDASHALEFAIAAARRVGHRPPGDPVDLLIWGSLHTVAAHAAACQYEAPLARNLLRRVSEAASAVGEDRHYAQVWFGRAHVRLTEMFLALQLGRVDDVVSLADRAEPYEPLPPNLRAAHFDMLAYCYARRRESAAAVLALLQLEQVCPEEIRFSPRVGSTLHLLLRRNHPSSRAEVARLARLAGL